MNYNKKILLSTEDRKAYFKLGRWNEEACRILGLNFRRDSRQVLTMTIEQGGVQIFHEWSSFKDERTMFNLHKMAELAIKKYIKMLEDNGYRVPVIRTAD